MIAQIIWDINPWLFDGFEYFRWYGLCWLIGILIGYRIIQFIYKSENVPLDQLDILVTYVMLAALIGARFGHILFYDPIHYWNNPIEILPIRLEPTFEFTGLAGLASHGGVIGAFIAVYLYNRRYNQGYLWIFDRLAIASAALFGMIRIGNLLNSEIIGKATDLPWAFIFTRIDGIPRHPTQLYEALLYFSSGIILFLLWRSKKYAQGQGFIFGMGLTLMASQRFMVEFLKENQVAFEDHLTLNMGQNLSIPLIVLGVILMIWSAGNSDFSIKAHR